MLLIKNTLENNLALQNKILDIKHALLSNKEATLSDELSTKIKAFNEEHNFSLSLDNIENLKEELTDKFRQLKAEYEKTINDLSLQNTERLELLQMLKFSLSRDDKDRMVQNQVSR